MSRLIYVWDEKNVIHLAEIFGKSSLYYPRCGLVIQRGGRSQTFNFDDVMKEWICSKCIMYSEFSDKKTRYEKKPYSSATDGTQHRLIWLDHDYNFTKVEYQYMDYVDRCHVSTARLQNLTSPKRRKKAPYEY